MWQGSLFVAQAAPAESIALDPSTRISQWVETGREFLIAHGPQFATNLLGAFLVFLIGKWAAGMLTGFVQRMMQRAKVDEMLVYFISNVLFYVLLAVVLMAALDLVGVDTTSLAAVLAAAGFAVGMALQGSLGNFAAGIMLIVFKPFRVGDFVEAGGSSGSIEEILIFNTQMRTPDNRLIVVPNSQITGNTITNFSAKPTRRIDLIIGCGYGDDLPAVKSFLMSVIEDDPRVLDEPAPTVGVNELGDSSVNFFVRPWVQSADYWAVRADLTERIKLGFDTNGFSFPFPSRDVYMHPTSPAPKS
ncbi:MAG: mechanosensitive ion channel family protein [Planctomycetaceae bacterium]